MLTLASLLNLTDTHEVFNPWTVYISIPKLLWLQWHFFLNDLQSRNDSRFLPSPHNLEKCVNPRLQWNDFKILKCLYMCFFIYIKNLHVWTTNNEWMTNYAYFNVKINHFLYLKYSVFCPWKEIQYEKAVILWSSSFFFFVHLFWDELLSLCWLEKLLRIRTKKSRTKKKLFFFCRGDCRALATGSGGGFTVPPL